MQDKMKRLLDQIGMNTDYLEKATIKKIVVYDNNKLWNFIIENDKILPVYIYTELINKIKINFSTIEDIKLSVIVREDNDEYINDYIDNLINIFLSILIKSFILIKELFIHCPFLRLFSWLLTE